MGAYSLNALLAAQVELETPTIKEANGSFEREELESAFSWLCDQAKQTRFKLEKIRSITITGDKAQVELTLTGLVELPTYRPADGKFDVTFDWEKEEGRLAADPRGVGQGALSWSAKFISRAFIRFPQPSNQSPRNTNSSATRFSERRAAGIASESAPNNCREALFPAARRLSAALAECPLGEGFVELQIRCAPRLRCGA